MSLFAEDRKTAVVMNKKQKKMLELAKEAKNTSIAVSTHLLAALISFDVRKAKRIVWSMRCKSREKEIPQERGKKRK